MHLLLITLCYLPDDAPNAPIMTGLAEAFVEFGHRVSVVTAHPHYGENHPDARSHSLRSYREECRGVSILRTPLYIGKEHSSKGKLLSWLSFNAIATWYASGIKNVDIILAPSPPLTLGLTESLLGARWHVPYIYNVQDIYPDIAVEQGYLRNPRLIGMFRWVENRVYSNAAAVTVLSEAHRANLLAKGVPPEQVVIIPNLIDTDFVRPVPRRNLWAAEHGANDHFIVAYAGNIGASQALDTLLGAARLLQGHPEILFQVIGRGSAKAELESRVQEWGLRNIAFLAFQPREQLPQVYGSADVHLVLLRRGIMGSVPSKIFTIMAAGRPIIACVDEASDAAHIVRTANAGVVIPPENPQELAETIRRLAQDSRARAKMGECGRAHVVQYYSKRAIGRQYVELCSKLISERGDKH